MSLIVESTKTMILLITVVDPEANGRAYPLQKLPSVDYGSFKKKEEEKNRYISPEVAKHFDVKGDLKNNATDIIVYRSSLLQLVDVKARGSRVRPNGSTRDQLAISREPITSTRRLIRVSCIIIMQARSSTPSYD